MLTSGSRGPARESQRFSHQTHSQPEVLCVPVVLQPSEMACPQSWHSPAGIQQLSPAWPILSQSQPSCELADVAIQPGLAYTPSWLLLVPVFAVDCPSPACPRPGPHIYRRVLQPGLAWFALSSLFMLTSRSCSLSEEFPKLPYQAHLFL